MHSRRKFGMEQNYKIKRNLDREQKDFVSGTGSEN